MHFIAQRQDLAAQKKTIVFQKMKVELCFSAPSAGIAEEEQIESAIPCHDAQVMKP